jgi:hypothetical protein
MRISDYVARNVDGSSARASGDARLVSMFMPSIS